MLIALNGQLKYIRHTPLYKEYQHQTVYGYDEPINIIDAVENLTLSVGSTHLDNNSTLLGTSYLYDPFSNFNSVHL